MRFVFPKRNGTGCIDEDAARCDIARADVENVSLNLGKRGDIRVRLAIADIRFVPEQSESAAGRVDQHAIERLTKRGIIGRSVFFINPCGDMEPGERLFQQFLAMRVELKTGQIDFIFCEARKIGAFSAGCGAGVEHALSRRIAQRTAGEHRAFAHHGKLAL
ncbi:hypothetical protein SDC9_147703 [bioreactor metagenome]|uniref:Uncharacterized protein n=1 Tax=bioreactor metagenome TaxID=1076179 RepID=A0A645EER9_9ZZZZ